MITLNDSDFSKLSINDSTSPIISENDLHEVEILNPFYGNQDWEGNITNSRLYLPEFEKFCNFLENNNSSCKFDRNSFAKYYNKDKGSIEFPDLDNVYALNFLLKIFGALNLKNQEAENLSKIVNDEKDTSFAVSFITKESCYYNYLLRNIETLIENLEPSSCEQLKNILEKMGLFLEKTIYEIIYKKILTEKKILITVAGGNNFWIKSDKSCIDEDHEYTLKLNNYSFLYMNWYFINEFVSKIVSHPRCKFAIISSMAKRNLEKAVETLKRGEEISQTNSNIEYLFDQDGHEIIDDKSAQGGKSFKRCLKKIKEKTKNHFDDSNTIIIESEVDKADNIKFNMIEFQSFSEETILASADEKENIHKKIHKLINYLENLLNECAVDVKEYLAKNSFNGD